MLQLQVEDSRNQIIASEDLKSSKFSFHEMQMPPAHYTSFSAFRRLIELRSEFLIIKCESYSGARLFPP